MKREVRGTGGVVGRLYRDPAITALLLRTTILLVLLSALLGAALRFHLPSRSLSHIQSVDSDFHDGGGAFDEVLHPALHSTREAATQEFSWNITKASRRADGVLKDVFLVNGRFPGPTIEARSGDRIIVRVKNGLTNEGVAIHWHGLLMRGQVEQDGVVGFTQCSIPPGRSRTYDFRISDHQHGTYWYHAHEQVERGDGLYGGFVIHKPTERGSNRYDEERLLLVGDWYHRKAEDVMKWYLSHTSFGSEPVPDSLVINGRGAYNCSKAVPARPIDCVQATQVPAMSVDPGKRYRFRVVNTGTLAGFNITMPEASLQILEVDGGQLTSDLGSFSSMGILYPGERIDFAATWTSSSSYFQIDLDEETFRYANPTLMQQHRFPVQLTDRAGSDFKLDALDKPSLHISLDELKPSELVDLPRDADDSIVIYTTSRLLASLHNVPHGFMNHTSWAVQSQPSLPLMALPRSHWDANQFVPHIPYSKESPRWVDLVVNNLDDSSHPFHLHGHDFYVLSTCVGDTYWGSYNPFDASVGPPCPINYLDPLKKDTVAVPSGGYVVLRFLADNPGIWIFHCHIMYHEMSGMAMAFQVGEHDASVAAMSEDLPEGAGALITQGCPTDSVRK